MIYVIVLYKSKLKMGDDKSLQNIGKYFLHLS
jgi:hypothetical protein